MGYRLLAFDLDGTLYDRHAGPTIPSRTREAVDRVRRLGAEVTIATGRMFNSTLRFSTELGLTTPIICFQGALVIDPVTEEVIWERRIPVDVAKDVIGLLEGLGLTPYVFVRDSFYVHKRNLRVEQYEDALNVQAEEVGDLGGFLEEDPTKLVVVGNDGQISEAMHRTQEAFGPTLSIVKTYDTLCEIGHPEGSKAKALSFLARRLGVSREETVAVGDSPNDVDMIRWAGLGVAMANSPTEVQSAADLVIKPVSQEGVVEFLDSLISEGRISPLR
ncbi:MAG: Cof-type HAD-IIB family hydrolase [Dehalococcoidia bacterium]